MKTLGCSKVSVGRGGEGGELWVTVGYFVTVRVRYALYCNYYKAIMLANSVSLGGAVRPWPCNWWSRSCHANLSVHAQWIRYPSIRVVEFVNKFDFLRYDITQILMGINYTLKLYLFLLKFVCIQIINLMTVVILQLDGSSAVCYYVFLYIKDNSTSFL